ncbi:LysR substrate-binding domain-containing protein [Peribacillus sp. NPDC096540]|uniref:LysR substrate-binding domain-containing protein n=1 Tax=Peribacillus sp. NPDC096540 TaxID=3390612 RepID=UPI003CFD2C1B
MSDSLYSAQCTSLLYSGYTCSPQLFTCYIRPIGSFQSTNQGITILPQSDLEEIDVSEGKIKVIPLIPHINWQVGIAWKKDSYISYATRTWIDFIKAKLENQTK